MQITRLAGEKTYCGGSLIAGNFVLTGASCLKSASSVQVDIGSTVFTKPFQTQHSTQFISHPQYNDDYKINNIGVIRLPANVTFGTNVRAILLPRVSDESNEYVSADSYLSGFGVSTAGSNYLSNELRYAHKSVISNDNCLQSFDSRYIQSSVMCAVGYNGTTQTTCYGDQGGALVSHIDGSWVQIGISSVIHPTGCTGTVPAGYTRLTPYLKWIAYLTGLELRP